MSDVDDGEDLEFLKAFEDELYNDQLSVCSDDSLDSELEAELYQNVHFASSLVETPTNNSKEKKVLDIPNESTRLQSQIQYCDCDGPSEKSNYKKEKQLDDVDGPHDGEQINDMSTNLYPEVELVFSKDKPKNKFYNMKGKTEVFFEAKTDGGNSGNRDLSDSNGWGIIAADLKRSKKGKRSYLRCFNCNEIGHRALECTVKKKEKVCWLCGEIGHLRDRCRNDLCFYCNRTGHQMKRCSKFRRRYKLRCERCHVYGHFEKVCPDLWRQYHHTINEGRIVQAIIQPELNERQDYFCYNCGEKGHLGHECPEETAYMSNRTFPFVVKYDNFTSNFSRVDENDEPDADTNLASEPNGKKSKNKKKKRAADEVASGEEKKATKRRKLEDGLDAEDLSRNPRDNRGLSRNTRSDELETLTDVNQVTSNLPLQPLMGVDFGEFGKKNKRKKKNPQEHPAEEVPVKKKKSKPNQQKKKRLKKMRLKLQQKYGNTGTSNINLESLTSNSISETHSAGNSTSIAATNTTINETHSAKSATSNSRSQATVNATPISETHHTNDFTPISAMNTTNNTTSISGTNTTENATSRSSSLSTANAATERNLSFQLGNERRLLVIPEVPRKPWRSKRKSAGKKRKVYFEYEGFL